VTARFIHAVSFAYLIPSLVLEIAARLTLFASVFAIFSSAGAPGEKAALLAAVASLAAIARTWWRGRVLGRCIEQLYRSLLRAVADRSTPALLANREHGQGAALLDAIFDLAVSRAMTLPDLLGSVVAVVVLLIVVALRLGVAWLGLGLLGCLMLLAMFAPARRAARRARERGWVANMRASRRVDALLYGSFELRASGRDEALERCIENDANIVARSEKLGLRLGGVTAVLPAMLAAALLATPKHWMESIAGSRLAETGVLALAGATFSLSALGGLDALTRSAPLRATLNAFLGPAHAVKLLSNGQGPAASPRQASPAARIHSLAVKHVSIRHGSAARATPRDLSWQLERGGVALLGPNGAGKTTALMAALGLVMPERGAILINGVEPSAAVWAAHRRCAVALPQRPYIVPDESIAWHLGLFGTDRPDDARMVAALERVGLSGLLAARCTRRGIPVAELPMGELSGGEQRRVALARALLVEGDLVILDEPEAGLDANGRAFVGKLLEEMARTRLVLVVTHDRSVIPSSFACVDVDAGELDAAVAKMREAASVDERTVAGDSDLV